MIKQFTLLTGLFCLCLFSQAQTILQGKVIAADTGEELISANIVVKNNGVFVVGISTDFNGNYSLNIDPGTYDIIVSYLGYPEHLIQGVTVKPDQVNILDVEMEEPSIMIIDYFFCCHYYYTPWMEIDKTTRGIEITTEGIQNSPFRNVKDLIINTPGVSPANY